MRILVEVHEHLVTDCSKILKKRFEHSHRCIEILESRRCIDNFPQHSKIFNFMLPDQVKLKLMNEGRVEKMKWLYFINRSSF